MSVVLDNCVLVDYYDETTSLKQTNARKKKLINLLADHDAFMSSVSAVEALYLLKKYPQGDSYNILLRHITAPDGFLQIIDPTSDVRILECAATLHQLGLTTEAVMTAAIAIVKQCPIVTASVPAGSDPDDYATLEGRDDVVVIRI